jgi:hypothetical protein
MIEDKLSQDQRIRLESLAQAIQNSNAIGITRAETIVDKAKQFENYVKFGTIS